MENSSIIWPVTDFSEMLKTYELDYSSVGYYWQVGEITKTQGWIIHLSVVKTQVIDLLNLLIRHLLIKKVPFKIARDLNTAGHLLDGGLGYIHLGKVVSIYPDNNEEAISIVQDLIETTNIFKGPAIPTDRHLGGIVYTRYGSFNPVMINNAQGEPIKHLHDDNGRLIPDPYTIPFELPKGVSWPFSNIADPMEPKHRKLLNYAYYPLFKLKPDVKGDVIKALYFKKIWKIHPCLIKQGRQNMFVDTLGRDIQDRLQWQFELYQSLSADIPMPKVFDLFKEYGDSYLAMAFIKGNSLRTWINDIYQGVCWLNLSRPLQLALTEKLLDIITIIQQLHKKGYVHRDITSNNFIIDQKGKIWLIDMELAWSFDKSYPNPCFALGTSGYMSPEQYARQKPTIKEDIYGVGALAQEFFTNLYPMKLDQQSPQSLQSSLSFFTGEEEISRWISICQSTNPYKRPSLEDLHNALEKFRLRLRQAEKSGTTQGITLSSKGILNETVQKGISGLVLFDQIDSKNRWISMKQRIENYIGNEQLEQNLYEGWHTGMAGPLWLIARAKRVGFDIDNCLNSYKNSWKYIKAHYLRAPTQEAPSLYSGGAGIAMALIEGLKSGLLSTNSEMTTYLEICFPQLITQPNLSNGLAGQGIALLCASKWMDNLKLSQLLKSCIDKIINEQQSDGSWRVSTYSDKKKDILIGLDHGIAGIVLFLLAHLEYNHDNSVKTAVLKSLKWLIKNSRKRKGYYSWTVSVQNRTVDTWGISFGIPGITLVFIKAYEILKNPLYREIAENSLLSLPSHPVNMDFSLGFGLAGLGEIYLEAFKVFKNVIWQERADWIAQVLLYSFKMNEENSGYWMPTTSSFITADLFTGNSGILHFLIRYLSPHKLNHPLSS